MKSILTLALLLTSSISHAETKSAFTTCYATVMIAQSTANGENLVKQITKVGELAKWSMDMGVILTVLRADRAGLYSSGDKTYRIKNYVVKLDGTQISFTKEEVASAVQSSLLATLAKINQSTPDADKPAVGIFLNGCFSNPAFSMGVIK